MRRKPRTIEIGDRYREAGANAFGEPRGRIWHVKRIYTGNDGRVYVTLFDPGDASQKTIAESALQDRAFYLPVD